MKTNSDEAIGLINLLTSPPPHGVYSQAAVDALVQLGGIIKAIDKENVKLRQEVQMLRAVLEQERDRVC